MACDDCKLHYFAGILDGEGCFTINRSINKRENLEGGKAVRYIPSIFVGIKDLFLIKCIITEIGGRFSQQKYTTKVSGKEGIIYKVDWCGADAQRIAKLFLDKLIVKALQAELIIKIPYNEKGSSREFSKEERVVREDIYLKMKELNK